ncbi:MAG: hypothetical protein PHX79_07600 [Sphaerochaetaceae bacterium]|nr:hypothetical protein [Sphaerochaetaceae bacterium]
MPNTVSVDKNSYTSKGLLGGTNIIIYCGPSKQADASALSFPDPGQDDSGANKFKLVGVIQDMAIQAGRPQRQLGELGSAAKYMITSRGQKSMTINRIVTYHGSGLHALYRYMYENMDEDIRKKAFPHGKIWTFLSHPVFLNPVGLIFRYVNYDDQGNIQDIRKKYHEDVYVAGVGAQITEGDIGITDNLSLSWSNTVTMK